MKNTAMTIIAAVLLSAPAFAHERITIGPGGGRLIPLASPDTPNAEFNVKDDKFVVTLLDKDHKPIPPADHTLTAIAGERSNPQKLEVEKTKDAFLAGPRPPGEDYWVILQLREEPAAKPMTFRVHYQTKRCPECDNPEWLCICGTKVSGRNITVPATLEGLFAEINQHHAELKEGFEKNDYGALEEVTEAFTVLLKALPEKSGDQSAGVQPQVDALVRDLAAIAQANAGRTLRAAGDNLKSFNTGLGSLKKNYPEKIANAKL